MTSCTVHKKQTNKLEHYLVFGAQTAMKAVIRLIRCDAIRSEDFRTREKNLLQNEC